MREFYQIAKWLTASWELANPGKLMPTSHGLLDHALAELKSKGQIPDRFLPYLTFAETRVGMRCLELPDILYCAQDANLTSEPNFRYLSTAVRLDEVSARSIISDLDIPEEDARTAGAALEAYLAEEVSRENAEMDVAAAE